MLFLFFALLYTAASVYIVRRMWRDKSGPFESKYNRDQQTLALSLAVGVMFAVLIAGLTVMLPIMLVVIALIVGVMFAAKRWLLPWIMKE
jgi:inner membrane protein involved in colicin E2 resistance